MSALDQAFRASLLRDFQALQRKLGITTVMVTHDPEEAFCVADRIAVIKDGRIQQTGSPSALYDYPVDAFVAGSVGTANLISGKVEENGSGMLSFYSSVTGCVTLCDSLHRPAAGPGLACFRPSSVLLVPYDHSLAGADRIVMHGCIARSEFRGGYVRYGVAVADQTIVCDLPRRTGTLAMPVGSEVQLAVDVSQIRFIQAG